MSNTQSLRTQKLSSSAPGKETRSRNQTGRNLDVNLNCEPFEKSFPDDHPAPPPVSLLSSPVALALERMMSPTGPSPNPNVPSEYCSTIPPLQQARAAGTLNSPPPTVMVPVSVLKHPSNDGNQCPVYSSLVCYGCSSVSGCSRTFSLVCVMVVALGPVDPMH